jgi:hypothetical protein
MNESEPGELGAGFLTAQHLFPPVHFNGFQVHSGQSLTAFVTVRSWEENLIFLLTVLRLHVLGPSYFLPVLSLSLNLQFRKVKSLRNSCKELDLGPRGKRWERQAHSSFCMYIQQWNRLVPFNVSETFLFCSLFCYFILQIYPQIAPSKSLQFSGKNLIVCCWKKKQLLLCPKVQLSVFFPHQFSWLPVANWLQCKSEVISFLCDLFSV